MTAAAIGAASTYDADIVAFVVVVAGPTVCTAGGTHNSFSADSCGQYNRITREKAPDGEGSQFDSLPGPGDVFWM